MGNLLRTFGPTLQAGQVEFLFIYKRDKDTHRSRRGWEVRSLEMAERSGKDSLDHDSLLEGLDRPR